jgi:hypothetical protein
MAQRFLSNFAAIAKRFCSFCLRSDCAVIAWRLRGEFPDGDVMVMRLRNDGVTIAMRL